MVEHAGRQQAYAEIVARAWSDEAFKKRLLQEPEAVLREYGIDLPEGTVVRPVENTPNLVHFVLPAQPEDEIGEEKLGRVSDGSGRFSCSFCLSSR